MEPTGAGTTERRGRRIVVVAVALLLVLFGTIAVVALVGDDGTSAPPKAAPVTGTGMTPISGLTPRYDAAVAWTGDHLFVFGGTKETQPRELTEDGALVDVMTGDAFPLPRAPFTMPLLSPVATRAGDQVLVLGITCPDMSSEEDSASVSCGRKGGAFAAATYDLGDTSWESLPVPAELQRLAAPASDGLSHGDTATSRVANTWPIVIGTTERGHVVISARDPRISADEYFALAPDTSEWTHLASPGRASVGCVTGNQVAVLTGEYERNGAILKLDPTVPLTGNEFSGGINDGWVQPTLRFLDVSAPGAEWEPSPTLDGVKLPLGPPEISCMGNRIMVVSGIIGTSGGYRVYDIPSRTWSTPPPAPGDKPTSLAKRVWTGQELLFVDFWPDFPHARPGEPVPALPSAAYDPAANTWRSTPHFPVSPINPQWTGTAVVDYAAEFDNGFLDDPDAPGPEPEPNRDEQAVRYTPG